MAAAARALLAGAAGRGDAGHGRGQSRPVPPRGLCLGRLSLSRRRRGAQAGRFPCSSSRESRVHGRRPPSRASRRRDRNGPGSLVARRLSSLPGFSLLGFSFFGFSPVLGFSFRGLSWDPRSPRGARSSPEASGADPPGSPWASAASDGSCFCAGGSGGPGSGSGGPGGGPESWGSGCGRQCGVSGSGRAHLPTGPCPLGESPHQVESRRAYRGRLRLLGWRTGRDPLRRGSHCHFPGHRV